MGRSLSSIKISSEITANIINNLNDGSQASGIVSCKYNPSMSSGVEANQANRAFQWKNQTISSGDNLIIDVYDFLGDNPNDVGAGPGKDAIGQELLMEEIVAIKVINENAVTADGQLEVVPASTNGWDPIGSHTVANGGALRGQGMIHKTQIHQQAFVVEDGVSHRLRLNEVGGDVSCRVYILVR